MYATRSSTRTESEQLLYEWQSAIKNTRLQGKKLNDLKSASLDVDSSASNMSLRSYLHLRCVRTVPKSIDQELIDRLVRLGKVSEAHAKELYQVFGLDKSLTSIAGKEISTRTPQVPKTPEPEAKQMAKRAGDPDYLSAPAALRKMKTTLSQNTKLDIQRDALKEFFTLLNALENPELALSSSSSQIKQGPFADVWDQFVAFNESARQANLTLLVKDAPASQLRLDAPQATVSKLDHNRQVRQTTPELEASSDFISMFSIPESPLAYKSKYIESDSEDHDQAPERAFSEDEVHVRGTTESVVAEILTALLRGLARLVTQGGASLFSCTSDQIGFRFGDPRVTARKGYYTARVDGYIRTLRSMTLAPSAADILAVLEVKRDERPRFKSLPNEIDQVRRQEGAELCALAFEKQVVGGRAAASGKEHDEAEILISGTPEAIYISVAEMPPNWLEYIGDWTRVVNCNAGGRGLDSKLDFMTVYEYGPVSFSDKEQMAWLAYTLVLLMDFERAK